MNRKVLTVGELKKALEGVPDNLEVRLSSDTGGRSGNGGNYCRVCPPCELLPP